MPAHKKIIFIFLYGIMAGGTPCLYSQAIYIHHALFYLPDGSPYLETYMALDGKFFPFFRTGDNTWQNKVSFQIRIKRSTEEEKIIQTYTVRGPEIKDTLNPPVFLDVQRYALSPGNQTLTLFLQEANSLNPANAYVIPLTVPFRPPSFGFSGLEWLEKVQKSENQSSRFYKNGFECYPYLINYFPEKVNTLRFYTESYCFHPFPEKLSVTYSIVDADDGVLVRGFQKTIPWNNTRLPLPVLGGFDISALPSGNYYLELKIRNASDSVLAREKHFFQRKNFFGKKDPKGLTAAGTISLESYLAAVHSKDTLYMMVECLYPISSEMEKDRQFNQLRTSDTAMMRRYLSHYWNRRAGDTVPAFRIFSQYMKKVYETNALFACGKRKGYNTEQGRVYLQYGPPSQVASQQNEANTYPYQIWHYYRAWDEPMQRYVTNRRFVFVNTNLADNCYRLVHSDMRGEINNERWMFDVMKRFNDGIQNIDNNTPVESGNTQMKDLYQAPR